MASAWIIKRKLDAGPRYRVLFRLGGRETKATYYGTFATMKDAKARRDFVAGLLARGTTPPQLKDLLSPAEQRPVRTVREVGEKWRRSRADVADGTAETHRVNTHRIYAVLGDRDFDVATPADVAELVAALHDDGSGLKRESIRKTRSTLAMIFDFGGRKGERNPARDDSVKLPHEQPAEVNPPTAKHVLAVLPILAPSYRLPLLVLDGTGMRVDELEKLRWGDVDELEGRWRVSRATAKTRKARWVPVPDALFRAVTELVPREDRDLEEQVFAGYGADRFRTALTRACKAAGVPHFHPHDVRHRRASLWHLAGIPAAEAASWLGHSAQEHLRTYAHVVMDRTEIDYTDALESARTVRSPVVPDHSEMAH